MSLQKERMKCNTFKLRDHWKKILFIALTVALFGHQTVTEQNTFFCSLKLIKSSLLLKQCKIPPK